MKKNYTTPEIEVIKFQTEDIMTQSSVAPAPVMLKDTVNNNQATDYGAQSVSIFQ